MKMLTAIQQKPPCEIKPDSIEPPTKSPSFIYRVLLSLHALQKNGPVLRGFGLDEITAHIKNNYPTDGDVASQVRTALQHCIGLGYVRRCYKKYQLIVGTAAIQNEPIYSGRRINEIERILKIFSANRAYSNCAKAISCSAAASEAPSKNSQNTNTSRHEGILDKIGTLVRKLSSRICYKNKSKTPEKSANSRKTMKSCSKKPILTERSRKAHKRKNHSRRKKSSHSSSRSTCYSRRRKKSKQKYSCSNRKNTRKVKRCRCKRRNTRTCSRNRGAIKRRRSESDSSRSTVCKKRKSRTNSTICKKEKSRNSSSTEIICEKRKSGSNNKDKNSYELRKRPCPATQEKDNTHKETTTSKTSGSCCKRKPSSAASEKKKRCSNSHSEKKDSKTETHKNSSRKSVKDIWSLNIC